MKWSKIKTFSLMMALLLGASCTKMIDLTPISSITANSFWKTSDDATGALYGMYARFRNVTARNLFIWGEARSEDLIQSVGNDFSNLRNFTNTMLPADAGPDWTTLYQVINDANLILENVPSIDFKSKEDKNRILAEAYSMRAFCYFVMARTWGGVPIVTESAKGYNPSKMYRKRSTIEEVFTLIKQDIDKALSLYPDSNFLNGRNRWSKLGTLALKGDVYLWTGKLLNGGNEDINISLKALDIITESTNVSLLSRFDEIFNYNNKGNDEIIMASNFTRHEAGGTFMANMYIDQMPSNADPSASDAIGVIGGGNYWTLSDASRNAFTNDDQRKNATFIALYTKDPQSGNYSKFYGCIQMKFNGMVDAGKRYFLDDVILYRYGGILLMKAEAKNALGMDPSEEINEVRKRAYGTNFSNHKFINGSQAQNDSIILHERLLELFYEGKRWWDILRFKKATTLVPYFESNPGDTYKFLWPISLDILSKEPNVEQNIGY